MRGGALARARRDGAGLDCALIACGLLLWQLVDYVYGDIGGPSTVLTGVALGLTAWWGLTERASADTARQGTLPGRVEEAVAR